MSLKDELIKLGASHKALRPHIRPVLGHLENQKSSSMSKHVMYDLVFDKAMRETNPIKDSLERRLRQQPEVHNIEFLEFQKRKFLKGRKPGQVLAISHYFETDERNERAIQKELEKLWSRIVKDRVSVEIEQVLPTKGRTGSSMGARRIESILKDVWSALDRIGFFVNRYEDSLLVHTISGSGPETITVHLFLDPKGNLKAEYMNERDRMIKSEGWGDYYLDTHRDSHVVKSIVKTVKKLG